MTLEALASLAGDTLLAAAVTDAWDGARHRFARFFGRGQRDVRMECRLDATRAQLAAVVEPEASRVRAVLEAQWVTRFTDFLEENQAAETELRAVVEEIRALLPAQSLSASGHSVTAGRDISVEASGGGVAAGVIHGSVSPPDPSVPDRRGG